jgi:hypothetical protein
MSRGGKGRSRLLKQGCAYCGAQATTLDHIPPKGFFIEPYGTLLKVPSCAACNNGASDDDEWVRNDLVLIDKNAEHPSANHLVGSAYRALSMPEKKKMRDAFLQTVQRQEARTEGGLYVPVTTFFLHAEPMRRVVSRIAKGLYWHHHGQDRLPDGYIASGFPVDEAIKSDREKTESWVAMLLGQEKFTLGNHGEFSYSFRALLDDDPHVTLWLLVFYGRFGIIALTHKAPNDEDPGRQESGIP